MPIWEIKALKLELSVLDALDGFIHEHALVFFMGAIYLLLALLVWVLAGALRPRPGQPRPNAPPVIVIEVDNPPSIFTESPQFDPFSPLRDTAEYDPNERWD
jgi:hypothetical protein